MRLLQYAWKNSILKLFNSKFWTFGIVMLVTCRVYDQPLRDFVLNRDYPVNWCVFPFLMCSYTFLILFWFGILYINTDVPFMQHINMYHVIRTGRKRWVTGHILGILVRSLTAVGVTAACSILPFLPHIEWSNSWGKLLKTAAMTDAAEEFGFRYVIYYDIFNRFTPLQLMGLCVLICWLAASLIGVLMFLFCLLFNKITAVACAAAMTILLFPVLNLHAKIRYQLALFVPTVWPEIARIATPDYGYYWLPPIPYMLSFLMVLICLISLATILRVRRIEFYWLNEDA